MTTVVELEIPAPRLGFARTFDRVSTFEFQIGGLVGGSAPLVWTNGPDHETIAQALEADPSVDVIGHPTGRLLNEREGLDVDVERVATAAADHQTALEINANPARLDLRGSAVQTAIEAGATITINTDAHSPAAFDQMRYGVHTARRGWAEAADVLNTWTAEEVRTFLD